MLAPSKTLRSSADNTSSRLATERFTHCWYHPPMACRSLCRPKVGAVRKCGQSGQGVGVVLREPRRAPAADKLTRLPCERNALQLARSRGCSWYILNRLGSPERKSQTRAEDRQRIRPPELVAMPVTLSLFEARRLAVASQGFSARPPAPSVAHLPNLPARLHAFQIDPMNVLNRAPYFPPFPPLAPH